MVMRIKQEWMEFEKWQRVHTYRQTEWSSIVLKIRGDNQAVT